MKALKHTWRIAALGLTCWLAACATTPESSSLLEPVRTDSGLVAGTGQEIRAFRGIPFAQAPVGALRWRAPQAAEAWEGVRDASRFGKDCMQPDEYPELRGGGMSEDCLFVNIWTPARRSGERLPVMVWVYGGGYTYGSGSHPSYDGEALARRGVVVVTFNYRMGLFGFMAHPQLSAESPSRSSGNYALMDQIAALQWVQRNIRAFGGDPARVTVAGQSAGALSITSLMGAPAAKGLFQQVILQSVGVMRPAASLASAEQFGLKAGADLATLRAMSAPALVQRLKEITPPVRDMTSARDLGVIQDGVVITHTDRQVFEQKLHAQMPMLVGSVANEGGGVARGLGIRTPQELRAYLERNFTGPWAERAAQIYAAPTDAEVPQSLANLVSDTQYLFGTREMLRLLTQRESRLYRYVFTQRRNGAATAPIHGDELQYPFDNLSALHRGRQRPFDASDAALAKTMADAWARFVKTGDPNGGD